MASMVTVVSSPGAQAPGSVPWRSRTTATERQGHATVPTKHLCPIVARMDHAQRALPAVTPAAAAAAEWAPAGSCRRAFRPAAVARTAALNCLRPRRCSYLQNLTTCAACRYKRGKAAVCSARRFYMLMSPSSRPDAPHRLIAIGKKRLPKARPPCSAQHAATPAAQAR